MGGSRDPGLPPGEPRPASDIGSTVPTGTDVHAFLIADVRGYTSFTQARGDEESGRLAARFAEVAREVIRGHHGEVLELRGDEALCVFGSPRSAIRAAVALQQRFVEETIADPSLPLTVGVGLDAGEAVPVEGGYRGGALNVAARLCSRARAGEVLASQEIVHLARRIDGVRFTERGQADLKGLDQPVHIVAVRAEAADTVEAIAPFVRSTTPTQAPHTRRNAVAAAVAFLLLVALVVVPLARRSGGSSEIEPNSIGILDPESGELSFTIAMPSGPGAITPGYGSLWVTNPDAATVTRIDEGTKAPVDTIQVGVDPAGIAAGEGAVWVVESGGPTVSRISPETNEVVGDPIGVGNGPAGVAVGEGAVWVTNRFDGTVSKIDPDKGAVGEVVDRISVGLDPSGIAVGFGKVWVALAGSNTVVRIDPKTSEVTSPIDVGNGPGSLVVSPDAVWVVNSIADTVSRIDPATTLETEAIPVGDDPAGIAFAEGTVWVANGSDGTLSRIDPGSDAVEPAVGIGSIPQGLATAAGSLWVTVRGTATSHRGGTLQLVSEERPWTLDPVVSYANPWGIMIIMGDGLMGFKRVGGVDGATLVPDLAVARPTPTDDGKTYRFQLRPGIAYSNGEIVEASDFLRGIERGFRIQNRLNPTPDYFGGIVGGHACSKTPKSCDLSEGIVGDDEAGTVTFHLLEPDPEFLYKLATPNGFPAPPSTPMHEEQVRAGVPGTGPYRLESSMTDDSLVLVRNEYFRQWSLEAQPEGNVDRIEWTFGAAPDEHVDAVSIGEADYMAEDLPPNRIEDLQVRFAGQVYEHPASATQYVVLNTSLPPFNEVDVRRALNLAVNRQTVVEFYGGPAAARLSCQTLPPNFPGYEPYCPYSIDPGPGGQWTGPNMKEAQRLVQRSGTAGMHVTFWYLPIFPEAAKAEAKYFVRLLEELHFVANLRSTTDTAHGQLEGQAAFDAHFKAISDPGRGIQIAWAAWGADYPTASNFFTPLLTCDSIPDPNYGAFCNTPMDRMIKHASQISTEDPAASSEAWAEVDRAMTDWAPWVPLVNPIDVDFVSERLENYQYNPQWGLLLAQVWVQ